MILIKKYKILYFLSSNLLGMQNYDVAPLIPHQASTVFTRFGQQLEPLDPAYKSDEEVHENRTSHQAYKSDEDFFQAIDAATLESIKILNYAEVQTQLLHVIHTDLIQRLILFKNQARSVHFTMYQRYEFLTVTDYEKQLREMNGNALTLSHDGKLEMFYALIELSVTKNVKSFDAINGVWTQFVADNKIHKIAEDQVRSEIQKWFLDQEV